MACDVFLDCVYCVYLVGVLVVCVVCLWCVWLLWWASVVCMCESVVFVCTWCVFVWCVLGGLRILKIAFKWGMENLSYKGEG